MRVDWCNHLGHKWRPIYVCGEYNGIEVRFIGTHCQRCGEGREELLETMRKQTTRIFGTSDSTYWYGNAKL